MKTWQRVCFAIAIAVCFVEICALIIEIIRPQVTVLDSPALPRWPVYWITGLGFLIIGLLPHRKRTLLGQSLSVADIYVMLLGNNGGFYSSDHVAGRLATSVLTLAILVFIIGRGSSTANWLRQSGQTSDPSRLKELLIGIVVLLVLTGYSGFHYSGLSQSSGRGLISPVVILIAYGIAAIRLSPLLVVRGQLVLRFGVSLGFLIGVVQGANVAEQFSWSSRQAEAGNLSIIVLLLFGAVAFGTYQHIHSIRLGIVASIWSAMMGTIIACLIGLVTTLFLVPYLNRIAGTNYLHGFHHHSFNFSNTLRIMTSYLLEAPIQAVVLGAAGGLLSYTFTRFCSVNRSA